MAKQIKKKKKVKKKMLSAIKSFARFSSSYNGITPLGSRVVVKLNEKQGEKVGSIFVPDSARKKVNQGEVMAVGPGALVEGKRLPMTLRPGMKVLLPDFGGQTVKLGKEEVTIISEEDVFGYFE